MGGCAGEWSENSIKIVARRIERLGGEKDIGEKVSSFWAVNFFLNENESFIFKLTFFSLKIWIFICSLFCTKDLNMKGPLNIHFSSKIEI